MRHKFRAKPVDDDGRHFSSTLEHRYYCQLKMRQKAGEIVFFLMQVPFTLPGEKTYRLDFMEFHANGEVVCTEVKGFSTPMGKLKIDMVEDLYPVKINVVNKV